MGIVIGIVIMIINIGILTISIMVIVTIVIRIMDVIGITIRSFDPSLDIPLYPEPA